VKTRQARSSSSSRQPAAQWLSPCSTQRTVQVQRRRHSSAALLDRSAGSKTDPIEMTVIDRALCAVCGRSGTVGSTAGWPRVASSQQSSQQQREAVRARTTATARRRGATAGPAGRSVGHNAAPLQPRSQPARRKDAPLLRPTQQLGSYSPTARLGAVCQPGVVQKEG
jgi:hypothetical protein